MKIRLGFVSNSSASSFCIYGWEIKTIEENIKAFSRITNNPNKDNLLEDLIAVLKQKNNLKLIEAYGNWCDVFGVGTFDDGIDHELGEGWESFESEGPTEEEVEAIDNLVKEYNLPKPDMFGDTWFNG